MKEMIAQLTAAAFLSLLAESLLPDGSFQKYARMVCGLIIMLVFLNALSGGHDFLTFSWEAVPQTLETEAAEKEREANLTVEYRRRMEEKIEEMTGMKASVEIGAEMEILSVTLAGEVSEEVQKAVSEFCGIEIHEVRGVTP